MCTELEQNVITSCSASDTESATDLVRIISSLFDVDKSQPDVRVLSSPSDAGLQVASATYDDVIATSQSAANDDRDEQRRDDESRDRKHVTDDVINHSSRQLPETSRSSSSSSSRSSSCCSVVMKSGAGEHGCRDVDSKDLTGSTPKRNSCRDASEDSHNEHSVPSAPPFSAASSDVGGQPTWIGGIASPSTAGQQVRSATDDYVTVTSSSATDDDRVKSTDAATDRHGGRDESRDPQSTGSHVVGTEVTSRPGDVDVYAEKVFVESLATSIGIHN